ncbi:MAG TPA: type II toxin-antitoxin system VapC family toxin [Blastocatellia bacterium]|nr:type II toxin-antitoxin system VapC family toxin [Blastocatellia bacterium]HMX25382.1 type II toxin-antitoxin system VapC family toxin [Blastocatellia bacterium]HMY74141.1 type II toxin-antitoxin system VapC family toxin [Blastocatellia bacterium]HMZ21355.1 type II toxin-antitoxin system VapC family toxin [Blastocatellia bacterium]HNG32991.1 type II toxin-antitoxin system VapC family toxin [Blastocatellia bacterium]
MKYLLDTNVCVTFLNRRNPLLEQRYNAVPSSDKIICSIVRAELLYGGFKSQRRPASVLFMESYLANEPNLDFDLTAARIFGELRADLERKGTPIGAYDLQIAAIALAHGLTLVTHNTREFSRVPNLLLEDWEI